ncbi:MAG TPA: sigma 54-interacting transcriptional regulator [Kofleriaceae bacterium]|nr:sigma 54-interacting transcriptional regulator [Kofleriaceae bacterium]
MSSVLLVDDEPGVLFTLREVLADRGHRVLTARSGAEALNQLDEADAVLTDLSMPGMTGLELMAQIVQRDPALPVVLLTAHGSERVAVAAMKQGAYHYLAKPFDIDEVAVVLERALEARRLRVDNRRLAAEQTLGRRIIGASKPMRRLLEATSRVAGRDVTVLVRGETGTGKEFVAELLHAQSSRSLKPLVRFNCAALPAELADAELFGHVKGAFTGATATRQGFFAQADGGTLILDEIGELPLAVQAKLLRVLQEGEIQPVGSGRIEKVNVRVVASTNRDLLAEAKAGTFREDLYYRLAVVELVVPPLRDRKDDIPALAVEFARRYGERFGLGHVTLESPLVDSLARADWPGNVRQLENTIARLAALSSGGIIGLADLQSASSGSDASNTLSAASQDAMTAMDHGDVDEPPATDARNGPSLKEQVEAFERGLRLVAAGGVERAPARRQPRHADRQDEEVRARAEAVVPALTRRAGSPPCTRCGHEAAHFFLAQAAFPKMGPGAAIIATSSINAFTPRATAPRARACRHATRTSRPASWRTGWRRRDRSSRRSRDNYRRSRAGRCARAPAARRASSTACSRRSRRRACATTTREVDCHA